MSSKICRFNILGNYRKTDNRRHNQKKDNALFFNFFYTFIHNHGRIYFNVYVAMFSIH